jgi:hypothetical protein
MARMSLLLAEVYQANTLFLFLHLKSVAQITLVRCSCVATIQVSRVGSLVRIASFR